MTQTALIQKQYKNKSRLILHILSTYLYIGMLCNTVCINCLLLTCSKKVSSHDFTIHKFQTNILSNYHVNIFSYDELEMLVYVKYSTVVVIEHLQNRYQTICFRLKDLQYYKSSLPFRF